MHSSVSPKDEIWFLRLCHHISTGLYSCPTEKLAYKRYSGKTVHLYMEDTAVKLRCAIVHGRYSGKTEKRVNGSNNGKAAHFVQKDIA